MLARTGLIVLLALATFSEAATAPYELRGVKRFENVLDSHDCRELIVRGKSLGWVHALQEVSSGLIVRQCIADEPQVPVAASVIAGDLRDGWYVVALPGGRVQSLRLPALGNFSNPSFCGHYGAYWAYRPGRPSSLVVADLDRGSLVTEVVIGTLELATDDMNYLSPAKWSGGCNTATFEQDKHISKTVLQVKSGDLPQRSR